MKNNTKWFSLPLAMGIVILITVLSISILEYIVPFSKNIKWFENSSITYYGANSWIEEWLYHIATRTNEIADESKAFLWRVSYEYNTNSKWNLLPPVSEWNSDYDIDWNTISSWNPIQLIIWEWYIGSWWGVKINFRVPNLDDNISTDENLKWTNDLAIVNWQLSATNDSLNADNSWWWGIITVDDINNNGTFLLGTLNWIDLNWWSSTFENFYSSNCSALNDKCTLKFSIVNKIETNDIVNSRLVPYLEWKFEVGFNDIPLRYTKIEWWWRSNGFKKLLDIKVPTQTVNEAFDFTVFQ